jgi:anhydro-N-acetylmuramic acid kinase
VNAPVLYIGLMSGTSLDGVDAALVEFESQDSTPEHPRLLGSHFLAFPDELRARLLALHTSGEDELHRAAEISIALSRLYAQVVNALIGESGIAPNAIRAIGSHGQTVRHRPEHGYTLQLGAPALLAELTGIAVVADFRSRDIAAGGQGAPLVPAFHAALFTHPARNRAIINIGGIANLTRLQPGIPVTGFDTGPGNMLMDAWAERHLHQPFDRDGAWAASGKVLPDLLSAMLGDAYFGKVPPKSTGRDHFSMDWLQGFEVARERPVDVQATLLELSARSIADCAGAAQEVWLCGGGAHNKVLVARITVLLPGIAVGSTEQLGLNPDWVEATAFAWLAKQTLDAKPGNLPGVTGAKGPRILGAVYPA